MKYKLILISLIIILLITFVFLTKKSDNKVVYDMECHKVIDNIIDDDTFKTDASAFINLDNETVTTMRLEYKVSKEDYTYNVDESAYYVDLYKDVKGINYSVSESDKYYYEIIDYDFSLIDLDNIASTLGNLIDEESYFTRENYSSNISEVQAYFLEGYNCK